MHSDAKTGLARSSRSVRRFRSNPSAFKRFGLGPSTFDLGLSTSGLLPLRLVRPARVRLAGDLGVVAAVLADAVLVREVGVVPCLGRSLPGPLGEDGVFDLFGAHAQRIPRPPKVANGYAPGPRNAPCWPKYHSIPVAKTRRSRIQEGKPFGRKEAQKRKTTEVRASRPKPLAPRLRRQSLSHSA